MAEVREGVSLNHAYKFHKDKKKAKGQKPVTQKIFRQVCYSFNKKLVVRVVEGFHTQLPGHMGYLRIVGRKINRSRMFVDFKATKEHGETIFHDNRETDGCYFFWNWTKPNHLVKNMQYYTYYPARGNKGDSPKEKLKDVLQTARGYLRYMILKT